MNRVYRATPCHQSSIKWYAIKIFDLVKGNPLWIEKCLKNEMFISKSLKHPNIIFTYDIFKTRRNGYIVMQFAPGGTIQSVLFDKLRRPYTEDEAKIKFTALMEGLMYIHHHNIGHRDLKLVKF